MNNSKTSIRIDILVFFDGFFKIEKLMNHSHDQYVVVMKALKGGESMLDMLNDVNWGMIAPIIVIQLILMMIALFDLRKREATNGPKWMWVLIIIFGTIPGPVAYFIFGRGE